MKECPVIKFGTSKSYFYGIKTSGDITVNIKGQRINNPKSKVVFGECAVEKAENQIRSGKKIPEDGIRCGIKDCGVTWSLF